MTSSEIVRLPFAKAEVGVWARSGDKRITNWPVDYILDVVVREAPPDNGARVLRDEQFAPRP